MTRTGRRYSTEADVDAHVREQAMTLVDRLNAGYQWKPGERDAKIRELHAAMRGRLAENLAGLGRSDLAEDLGIGY